MKRYAALVVLIGIILLLAACGNDDGETSNGQQLGPLDWDHDSNTIILRLDERLNEGNPARLANEIPPCTVWGDGRIVWVNPLDTQREILEARLTDDQVRQVIETVVFSGFYDWESNFAIPDVTNPLVKSITLNLYAQQRTVSRYADWPANGYQRILQACTQISSQPAIFLPTGAWISAYEVPKEDSVGVWQWLPSAAGFHLSEVANGQPPRWITGDLVKLVWTNTILPRYLTRVSDEGRYYEIAVQVPGVTRDAPPAPAQ